MPIGSVYQYFPSKDAILAELADCKFRDVDSVFVRARAYRDAQRDPAGQRLRRLGAGDAGSARRSRHRVREMKRALIAYLADDLDEATRAVTPRPKAAARKRKR